MRLIWAAAAFATIALASPTHLAAQTSPYAGQQTREIKSLSAQDIDDLLNARGMALAKAAELNGYPGDCRPRARARSPIRGRRDHQSAGRGGNGSAGQSFG